MTTVRKTKMLPPVWFALSIIAMAALHWLVPIARLIPRPWNWLGALLIVTGVALAMTGATLFRRRGTGVVPFSPATHLVTTGPYRFTRNPMYLGMVMTLAGIATIFGTISPWVVIVLFAAWINHRFIAQEEVMLAEVFGDDYAQFKRRVRRWI